MDRFCFCVWLLRILKLKGPLSLKLQKLVSAAEDKNLTFLYLWVPLQITDSESQSQVAASVSPGHACCYCSIAGISPTTIQLV
jgi:hypothetical protein